MFPSKAELLRLPLQFKKTQTKKRNTFICESVRKCGMNTHNVYLDCGGFSGV